MTLVTDNRRRRQGRPRLLPRRKRTSAERQVSDDMRKPVKKTPKDVVHVSTRLTLSMQRKLFEGYPGLVSFALGLLSLTKSARKKEKKGEWRVEQHAARV